MKTLFFLIPALVLLATDLPAASYYYDEGGRLEQVAYPQGQGIRYTYDAGDNVTSVTPITVPAAPANLSGERSDPATAQLAWQDAASNETGILIWRRRAENYGWERLATLSPNVTTYTDDDLDPSINYVYRISAEGDEGFSAYSNESLAAGSGSEIFTVRALTPLANSNRLELAFRANPGTTYRVETSPDLMPGSWSTASFATSAAGAADEAAVRAAGENESVYIEAPPSEGPMFYRVVRE